MFIKVTAGEILDDFYRLLADKNWPISRHKTCRTILCRPTRKLANFLSRRSHRLRVFILCEGLWLGALWKVDMIHIVNHYCIDYRRIALLALNVWLYKRLFVKLASYGIVGYVLQWIRHFRTGRRQRVGVTGAFSTWVASHRGQFLVRSYSSALSTTCLT